MKSNCAVRNSAITNRNTTMDTKALRQKILDLAIHGKLVPQDPNDEPASVLLERIKAEKERLIKNLWFYLSKLIEGIFLLYQLANNTIPLLFNVLR